MPKALKLAIPEKMAWRSHNPGIEAVARLMQAKNAMSDSIVDLESVRVGKYLKHDVTIGCSDAEVLEWIITDDLFLLVSKNSSKRSIDQNNQMRQRLGGGVLRTYVVIILVWPRYEMFETPWIFRRVARVLQ